MQPFSLYVHFPFCRARCSYCDFNTYTGQEAFIPAYLQALRSEAEALASSLGEAIPLHTVFFGGGTPSLLSPQQIENFLLTLEAFYQLPGYLEFTLEANPGTVSRTHLVELRAAGINRLSLGMQSVHPQELALLGRRHDYLDVIQAVKWARQARFENLSLDLIYDLPGQTMDRWQSAINLALDLDPDHFSLYALTIEEHTPMNAWNSRGLLAPQNPDLAADMYELADSLLGRSGYQQYEISNWAKPGYECQHNLQYWHNLPYLGLGAGAHGFVPGYRTVNTATIGEYIRRMRDGVGNQDAVFPTTPATLELIPIDLDTEMREMMMMGLRLTQEGVSGQEFQTRFGCSLASQFGEEINFLVRRGLLEWAGDLLRLTPKGRLLGNQVFQYFI